MDILLCELCSGVTLKNFHQRTKFYYLLILTNVFLNFPTLLKWTKPCRGMQMKATFNFKCDVFRYADFMQINCDLSIIEA